MNFVYAIKKHIKASLVKTFLVTLLFVFVYKIYNLEIIRNTIEDRAFDIVNMIYLNGSDYDTSSSPVNIMKVDKYALLEEKLLNDHNYTNYGYLYPRDKIAGFINKINKLDINQQPKALFIDFDFSFTSLPYSKKESQEDKVFIEALKQDRSYVILLPKTSEFNFVEKHDDLKIQKQISTKQIIFVSAAYTISRDSYSRRYLPYQIYEGKKYWNAPIVLWQIDKNIDLVDLDKFQQKDIIENRIIYKKFKETTLDTKKNGYLSYRKKSHWTQMESYSLNYPFEEINLKKSIILFGTDHMESNDYFNINSMYSSKISGIDMHANTLMTLFKNNGPFKRVPFLYSILIIFLVFLLVDITIESVSEKFGITSTEMIFMLSLLISSAFLLTISIMILKVFTLWFNWLIPFILFEIYEVIEISLYYYNRSKKKKGIK